MTQDDKPDYLSGGYPFDDIFNEEKLRHDYDSEKYDFEATERQLNERINEAYKKIDSEITKTKTDINKTRDDIQKELRIVKRQIDESKNRVVETLALFAALFTFLSLEVQVFKDENNPDKLLGLVLITGGLITFFVLILDLMVKTRDEASLLKTRFFLLLSMSILFVFAGVLLVKTTA